MLIASKKVNGAYTIAAEVYGKGIDMWLRSQGDKVQVLSTMPKKPPV